MNKITAGHVSVVCGALIAIGGAIGYFRKNSKASLIAGGVSGGALIAAGIVSFKDKLVGYGAGAVVSGLLTISMGRRFVATNGGLIPGIVTLISTTALVANGYAFYLL